MSDFINRKDVLDILDQCARNILFDYGLHGLLYECMEEIEKLQTVELCEDCVSRKSAVEAVRDHDWMQAVFTISHLPSVMPERKKGKWIRTIDPDVNAWTGGHRCSECGRDCVQMSMNYCANCGAPMEVDG